ncbi:AAA family ATPase [Actinokineospora iranica]|uniref:AAA family ATPase n=1 Tax=Actinokineospora iranica TaxID=1271860 RepID=UPI001E304AE9|nr:ATP-binding protein [Actinokineospora iranica]
MTSRWFDESGDRDQLTLPGIEELYGAARNDRAQALALLQMADLGIDDVVIDQEKRNRVSLVHRSANERVLLDFAAESEGTRTWFKLIGPVLTALKHGSLLLFDELAASLHPTLSSQLIRLFQDPATNPRGAQLVFTSHDTSLLNHLNRDEVWLTEKTEDGATRLGALADFAGERVRKSQNLEKAYLHGRFGALPDVDRTDVLRALGLIG